MLENLANLYQELIIEHSKNPRNAGTLNNPNTKKCLGINPSCGDKLVLFADIEDNKIIDIKYEGDGCSIFQASCSLMSQLLIGKTIKEAQELLDLFMKLIIFDDENSLSHEELKKLGKLQVFENIKNYPARVKCAALFVRTLQNILENKNPDDAFISTEND